MRRVIQIYIIILFTGILSASAINNIAHLDSGLPVNQFRNPEIKTDSSIPVNFSLTGLYNKVRAMKNSSLFTESSVSIMNGLSSGINLFPPGVTKEDKDYSTKYDQWLLETGRKPLISSDLAFIIFAVIITLLTGIAGTIVWNRQLTKKVTIKTEKLNLEIEKKDRILDDLERALNERDRVNRDALFAMHEAEEANNAKSRFMAKVSHELRTPLHGIIGISGILTKTELNQEQRELLNVIETSSKNLFRIITDLLDLSKINAGKMRIEKTYFNIDELENVIISVMKFNAENKGLEFTYEFNNSDSIIYSDKERIGQIIYNLLSNAIKYTDEGFVSIEINQGHNLVIVVRDSGRGIPDDMREKVFDSFTQVSENSCASDRSLGIGLSIVKEIVTLLNGKISVRSKLNKGSTFTVEIPIKVFSQADEETDSSNAHTGQVTVPETLYILAAEDESVNRLFLTKITEKMNWQLDIAETGEEALSMAYDSRYDVILMDISLPDITGIDATKRLREFECENNLEPTPVIAVTAHEDESIYEKCIAAGMNGIITKPFFRDQLFDEIRNTYISSKK